MVQSLARAEVSIAERCQPLREAAKSVVGSDIEVIVPLAGRPRAAVL